MLFYSTASINSWKHLTWATTALRLFRQCIICQSDTNSCASLNRKKRDCISFIIPDCFLGVYIANVTIKKKDSTKQHHSPWSPATEILWAITLPDWFWVCWWANMSTHTANIPSAEPTQKWAGQGVLEHGEDASRHGYYWFSSGVANRNGWQIRIASSSQRLFVWIGSKWI